MSSFLYRSVGEDNNKDPVLKGYNIFKTAHDTYLFLK